jgi:hypothetical protein
VSSDFGVESAAAASPLAKTKKLLLTLSTPFEYLIKPSPDKVTNREKFG